MLKNKLIALLIFTLIIPFSAIAKTQSFDARSFGMGGTGVSSADYLTAGFHNPALAAKYSNSDDIGVMLPMVGAQAQDSDEIVKQIDDFSSMYDNLGVNSTLNEAEDVVNSLKKMQGDSAHVQASIGASIAIPTDIVSVNVFGRSYVDAFVLADISNSDLDPNSYLNSNYTLSSNGVTLGVAVNEVGVAVAKSFELEQGTLYVGATPKYQSVKTINYSVSMDDYDFDNWDNSRYQSDHSNGNLDLGVAYEMNEGWVFGLSGRNMFKQTYNTKASPSGSTGVYELNQVYTASASFNHSLVTVAVDLDLNETERYTAVKGLESGDFDASDDNTQNLGIGAEFNAWDWGQARVGYQHDLTGNTDGQVTAGLGFSPWGVFHVDVAGSYGGSEEFGAAVQTSLTF